MAIDALLLANIASSLTTRSASRIPTTLRALLHHEHIYDLEQNISSYQYDDGFEVVGNELGIDPPTMLCAHCRELMRNPPKLFDWRNNAGATRGASPPVEFWVPFHSSFFQLVDCCHSRKGRCHLCQLFWHGFQREIIRRRENGERFSITWYNNDLEACLSGSGSVNFCLSLNFSLLPHSTLRPEFHLLVERGNTH